MTSETVTAVSGGEVMQQESKVVQAPKLAEEVGDSALHPNFAQAHLLQKEGMEALDKQNFELAVTKTAEALKTIIEATHELSVESAPFYYAYGSALLEQVQAQSDVFGDSIKAARQAGLEQVALEEEDQDPEADVVDQTESDAEALTQNDAETVTEIDAEAQTEDGAEDHPENDDETEACAEAQTEIDAESYAVSDEDEAKGEEENEEDEERPEYEPEKEVDTSTDMEVTWELLETARVIYQRLTDMEGQLGLAKTLHRLGDFRLENDDVSGAIADYNKALEIREELLEKDDRRLATSHHAIALALINNKNCEQALDHFVSAKAVFARRVAKILGIEIPDTSKNSEGSDTGDWRDSFKTITEETFNNLTDELLKDELKEYVEILQELDDKIIDTETTLKEIAATPETHSNEAVSNMIQSVMAEAAKAAGLMQENGFEQSSSNDKAEPTVNNLGTIVGQKRKLQVDEAEEPALKQAKDR